jgi:polynucleotide 5'-kinase involved in rRNA processing
MAIINTAGWVKGDGKQLMLSIVQRINPTHVLFIVENKEDSQVPLEASDLPDAKFYTFRSRAVARYALTHSRK